MQERADDHSEELKVSQNDKLLLLAFYASGGPSYGFRIRRIMRDMTTTDNEVPFATLYSRLHHLVAIGYLAKGEDIFTAKGPQKIVYSLTEQGRLAAEQELEQLKAIVTYVTAAQTVLEEAEEDSE